jgi:hypothetical protein
MTYDVDAQLTKAQLKEIDRRATSLAAMTMTILKERYIFAR